MYKARLGATANMTRNVLLTQPAWLNGGISGLWPLSVEVAARWRGEVWGLYYYVPSAFDSTDTRVGTGGSAYMAVASQHSGAFVNLSVRTPVTGLDYSVSPVFYMTATFNSLSN